MIQVITSVELATAGDARIIMDTRASAAYNGWPLRGEPRGGHMPGAVSFPAVWLDELGEEEARKLLLNKGVLPERTVVVTGYADEREHAAGRLDAFGYASILLHTDGMADWLCDLGHPAERLPRYRHLVHPGWLRTLLREGEHPDNIRRYVLAHVNFDNWGDYHEGHIPGAIWLDTLLLEDDTTWNRRTPEELEMELSALGITRDTCVVLYGRTAGPDMSQEQPGKRAGYLGAMRAAAILMYAGIRDVRVLDGGLDAWTRAGGAVTRDEIMPVPVKHTGLRIPEHPEYMIDMPEVKRRMTDSNTALVSIRSRAENSGEFSGYHYIRPMGRIPGSIFGNNGSDAYHMEYYRNHDDTMRSYHEIAANWQNAGIDPEKRIAFYCGTGWRASEAFFYAWLMGWEHISVYDGGWYEWSSDPTNPVETGMPEDVTREV